MFWYGVHSQVHSQMCATLIGSLPIPGTTACRTKSSVANVRDTSASRKPPAFRPACTVALKTVDSATDAFASGCLVGPPSHAARNGS